MSRILNKQTLEEGFNKFVIKNKDECWDWSGCAPKNPGYGQFRYSMKIERAHRASWLIHYGEIPLGMHVLHKCDNPICSNPKHLFLGTHADNMRDSINKNRNGVIGKSGEQNHMSKLKYDDVQQIRELIASGVTHLEISKKYNVHVSRISDIKNNRTWSGRSTRRSF